MRSSGRIDWVDYAKAIGIVLVVYGHVARGIANAGLDMPRRFYELADSIVYSFHMPLFLFLAGLLFFRSYDSRRSGIDFTLSKVDTIVYPYLVWSLFQGSIEAALAGVTNGDVTYLDVVSVLWAPRAQFWFLHALFVIFLIAAVFFAFAPRRAALPLLGVAAALYLLQDFLPAGYLFSHISTGLVFFVLGIVFEMYVRDEEFFDPRVLGVLILAAVLGQYLFHVTFGHTYMDRGVGTLFLAVVSLLLVINTSYFLAQRPNPVILLVGASSMAIFVLHVIAGSGMRIVLHRIVHVTSYAPHLILGMAVGLVAPLVCVYVFQKLGFRYAFSAPISKLFRRHALKQA